jgi:hypothetical protein
VSNQWIISIRRFGSYIRRDGNDVIPYDEKCAAVDCLQRRDDLRNAWRQEPQKIVLPLDACDARHSVADDVRATPHNVGTARCEQFERRVEVDAPVRANVRRGDD